MGSWGDAEKLRRARGFFFPLLEGRKQGNEKVPSKEPCAWSQSLGQGPWTEGRGRERFCWHLLEAEGRTEEGRVSSGSPGSRLVTPLGVRALVFPRYACMDHRGDSLCLCGRIGIFLCQSYALGVPVLTVRAAGGVCFKE